MNRKQYSLTVALALIAGLVGGMVSSQFFVGQPVWAEKKAPHEKVVRAEKFEVVNGQGEVLARLRQAGLRAALEFLELDGSVSMDLSGGEGVTEGLRFFVGGETTPCAFYQNNSFMTDSELGGVCLLPYSDGPTLAFFNDKGPPPLVLGIEKNGEAFINVRGLGENSHKTVIGYTELVTPKTGETHARSAASIVMFDKKGSVVWSAP